MSVKFFKSLLYRSARIQREIDHEHRRLWPDWLRLLKLKKLRLTIKDKMLRLMRQGIDAGHSFPMQPSHIRLDPDFRSRKNNT